MGDGAARLAAIHAARSQAVIEGIESIDPDFVLHLASSTLNVVLDHFIGGPGAREGRTVFAMPREEEGVAVASGLELAGRRPVMIFQDNGLGNLLTVLLTFPQPYHVPLYGVVSRRGGLGEYNSMIHTVSERVEAILDAAGVRWFQLDVRTPVADWAPEIKRAWTYSRTTVGHLKPDNLVVLLLDNGVYLATGGQPTAAADADLVAVALACGWAGGREVRTEAELGAALDWAREAAGPLLVRVYVSTAQLKTDYLLADPAVLAEDFRRWLRSGPDRPARAPHDLPERPIS